MFQVLTLLQAKQNLSTGKNPVFGAEWSDAQKVLRINEVLERWYNEGTWTNNLVRVTSSNKDFEVKNGILTLEPEYYGLSRLTIPSEQANIEIKPKEFEFRTPDSPGPMDWSSGVKMYAIDRGYFGGKRQYLITGPPEVVDTKQYEGLARKRFVFLSKDLEEINPPNFGALKQGCIALEYEAQGNFDMANAAWANCLRLLNEQLYENIQDTLPRVDIAMVRPNQIS